MIEQILQADRLLVVDQVDKAREIYQRVVELDPGNAIATVGLARCALADGEDALAYDLAAKALTIDPENDMARRMEARLSEILATRGAAVPRPAAAATPATREMRPVVTGGAAGKGAPDAGEGAGESAPGAVESAPGAGSDLDLKAEAEPRAQSRRSLLDRLRGR